MKVLHVTATGRRRGGEVFASDLTRCLERRGVEQRVLVLRSSSVDVDFGVPVLSASPEDRSRPLVRRAISILHASAEKWQPDILQAHGGEALKHAVLSGASNDTPLVYRRIGGASAVLASSRFRRWGYSRLMLRARYVVAVSDSLRDATIEGFALPKEQVVAIPNAVDPARVRPGASRSKIRGSLDLDEKHRVILSLGSLSWEKDPDAHLAAAGLAMARDPLVVHLVVGEGPLRRRLESEVAGTPLGRRHRFLGQRTDVGDLMSASDVLLFASRPDGMEGMPAVLIEAAMVGLPAVAFDVAGISEVITDDESGLLVPWRQIDCLADTTLRLLGDRSLSARLADNARRSAVRFEIETIGDRYLSLYESIV